MRPYSPLPTLPRLGINPEQLDQSTIDPHRIAAEWFSCFSKAIQNNNVDEILSLFIEESFWRDLFALTWNLRTFQHASRIRVFLQDCLIPTPIKVTSPVLDPDSIILARPYTDFVYIQSSFAFETEESVCSGIFRLVPQPGVSEWKAHCILTNLEGLKGHPEHLWSDKCDYEEEPTVVIVGAGHCGLELAARLKHLRVPTLVIERNARVGDNWRNRYDVLRLHDPIQYLHMPYLPFPSTWPERPPAHSVADWFETYVDVLGLSVWTSSEVTSARKAPGGAWIITTSQVSTGQTRILKTKHLVFATGLGGGAAPDVPGLSVFKGLVVHSSQYKKAQDYAGKKVVVVGTCSSGFDICVDCVNHDVDVTMYQRGSSYVISTKSKFRFLDASLYCDGGPPTDVADRIAASFPQLSNIENAQRKVKVMAEADRDVLNGLKKVGFRTNMGLLDAGFTLPLERRGGFYLDVGGSQYVIDGRIKLKSGSQISSFTPSGLIFADGSEVEADVVVFATGQGDYMTPTRRILGNELASSITEVWGL